MGTQIRITGDNLNNIAAKLDAASANLTVEERGLLASVFQAAAVQIHGDVQGFGGVVASGDLPAIGSVFGAVFTHGIGAASASAGAAGVGVDATTRGGGTAASVTIPGVGTTGTYVVL